MYTGCPNLAGPSWVIIPFLNPLGGGEREKSELGIQMSGGLADSWLIGTVKRLANKIMPMFARVWLSWDKHIPQWDSWAPAQTKDFNNEEGHTNYT